MEKSVRPLWLDILDREMGVAEVPGPDANPRVMEYFQACGGNWVKDDATPWCGAALGWAIRQSGYPLPPEPLRAKGWLTYGTKTILVEGAIVILNAPDRGPEAGHVGLCVAHRDGRVYLLGGNQGDKVSIAAFPEGRIADVRWPPGAPTGVYDEAADAKLKAAADTAAAAATTSVAPGNVWLALKQSKTILGALTTLLGVIIQYCDQGVELLLAGAAEISRLEPAMYAFGFDVRSAGAGISVFGISLVLLRRLQAAATGKEG